MQAKEQVTFFPVSISKQLAGSSKDNNKGQQQKSKWNICFFFNNVSHSWKGLYFHVKTGAAMVWDTAQKKNLKKNQTA